MRSCLFAFFCLIFCVFAFPQDQGIIRCDSDMTQVPAWTSPGGAWVIQYLACGQMVSLMELDRGYFRIQIGGRSAYVYAKYVSLPEIQELQMAEPEEQAKELQEPVSPETSTETPPQPTKGYPGEPRRHEGGLYFEISHIYYDEPNIMRNKGFMWGVSGDYTYRPNNFMFKVDGRFSFGNVDYWSDGTGTAEDLRDYNFETRFSFGYDLKTASKKASFTPFIGLGYRYLFDGESGAISSSGYYDYDRKSNYLYSPMGMETIFSLGTGWALGLAGEYDLFWHGWQYSQFEDIDPFSFTAKNDQANGWGARGSLRIIKNLGRVDFALEPFFRYWDIDESDWVPLVRCPELFYCDFDFGSEPANTTTEWGGRVGIRF